ncbi:uncharacterized protein BDW43DRAFT_304244 [Aspergillus alliaceus]|uniref:uncharacterized protein n=1 Tax=Petromyces alliaceus TaxID=209559 RepID=UPI0012A5D9F3|nr:uncharacterized protein BDW43DRAFT_304244 [Aspergillus alliaceus]KAB8227935.1 hypothetical protein BDW43DRAFT_304244 [Aspergillus alliaceus]
MAEVVCLTLRAPVSTSQGLNTTPQSRPTAATSAPTAMISSITAGLLRAGGPKLCEIPYNSRSVWNEDIPFDKLRSIVQSWNIRGFTRFVECTPCYDDSAEPIPTLQVCVHPQEDESRENWLNAAQEMHGLLRSYGFEHVTVDIIDWRLEEGPRIFVCEPTDTIFSKWDNVRKRILDSVDVSGFQLLGCYRMGYETCTADCEPTILVTVDPNFERDWNIARQDISNTLNEFELPTVDVQIHKDRNIFCARRRPIQSEINSRYPVHTENGPRVASIGHSVGAQNSDSYGTFGGWLNIRQKPDSEWEPFGLTCRHCVFNHHLKDLQEVDCPSYGEIKRYIGGLKETVSDLKRREPYRTLEELRADGDLADNLKAKWQKLRAPIDTYEAWIVDLHAYCDSKMYRFGEVWAHSGDGTRITTTVMDWALLRPHPTRAYPSNKFGQFADKRDPKSLKLENGFIVHDISLDHHEILHKYGCKTNATISRYNMLATTIFTVAANGKQRATDEHSVLCETEKPYFEPGDSGALIFTESGAMVGMGFGGQVQGQIFVFTHVNDLITDIKDQTGVDEVTFYAQEWPSELCEGDQD